VASVAIPNFTSRIVDALGATGCALFVALSCAFGFEANLEQARTQIQPLVKLSWQLVDDLQATRWGLSPESERPAVIAPTLFALTPRPEIKRPEKQSNIFEDVVAVSLAAPVRAVGHVSVIPKAQATGAAEYSPPRQDIQTGHGVRGWVLAGTELVFSAGADRPKEVTFMAAAGVRETLPVAADGRVQAPPPGQGPVEYSFFAPLRTAAPAVVAAILPSPEQEHAIGAVTTQARVATEVDFRRVTPVSLRGRLFLADVAEPTPIVGAEVTLVGDVARTAITDQEGYFDLGGAHRPEGAKLFIEAASTGGFKHRYEVAARNPLPGSAVDSEPVSYFAFSDEQIQGWAQSFEGGLSPQSGWVVGAAAGSDGKPALEVQVGSGTLTPETYALNANNQISQKRPSGRWLSIEIPEGVSKVGLKDTHGKWTQSTWAPISPGVINVIRFDAAK